VDIAIIAILIVKYALQPQVVQHVAPIIG